MGKHGLRSIRRVDNPQIHHGVQHAHLLFYLLSQFCAYTISDLNHRAAAV